MPRPGRFHHLRLPVLVPTAALAFLAATGGSPPVWSASTPATMVPASAVPAARTDAEVASMDPVDQGTVLGPLRAAAAALDAVGRHDAPAVYAGVALDVPDARTELYVTDPTRAAGLVDAARRVDPALTLAQVAVHAAGYPLVTLEAASRQVVDATGPFVVYAAYPAPDASGIQVEVRDPAAAGRTSQHRVRLAGGAAGTVPIRFVPGSPRAPHGWDTTKWHDTTPFIGGDVLTRDGHHYCTAGLPAVRGRHPVMVTAAHCFSTGQRVYTGAGKTWHYGNGRTGHYVGTVTRRSTSWDAELLDGAANAADESDTSGWKPLTSVAYSYRGDYVCHSGARSAADGHPTPCGIKVTIADLYFREGGHTVRGVEGVDVHGWGSVDGDSGGTVFAVEPHGKRQLRGLVSSGGADGTRDQRRVDWPEAVDIFRRFGLKLDPST